jgi:hypothetical protein
MVLGLPADQRPTAPDLAFIPFPKAYEYDFKPVPAVLERLARARLELPRIRSHQLLDQLFADRIPALDYLSAALNLGAEVTPARRQELIARERAVDREPVEAAMLYDRIATLNVQLNEAEGFASSTEGVHRFSVLDLDGDGQADLILIPVLYYGPTAGLRFIGRERGRFVYLGEQSGDIRRIDETAASIVLRYQVNVLEPSEAGITLNLGYDRRRSSWTVTRQLLAQQTELPSRLSDPSPWRTSGASELRTGPRADEGAPPADGGGAVTATLRGNVVARFPAKARCLALATQGEWAFVAFLPDAKPVESSFHHALDKALDRTRTEQGAAPLPSYLCGWIRRATLEKTR